jgi:uncharacterized protein (TIGR03435 family)
MDSERYDVTAKAEDGASARDQLQLMTRTLLEDRFKLILHHETKEVPVYVLLAGKGGPKLTEAKAGSCVELSPTSLPAPGRGPGSFRRLRAEASSWVRTPWWEEKSPCCSLLTDSPISWDGP